MTPLLSNNFFNVQQRPKHIDDETKINHTEHVAPSCEDLAQEVSSPTENFHEFSMTADCLVTPLQQLALVPLHGASNNNQNNCFYALAQNIFQFSSEDREKIYGYLLLDDREKNHLKTLCGTEPAQFHSTLTEHIITYSKSIHSKNNRDQDNILCDLADRLQINLMILKRQQDHIEFMQNWFSKLVYNQQQHECFQSELCVAVAEEKGLFKKHANQTFEVACDCQSACLVDEICDELAQIATSISEEEDLSNTPYQQWYQTHLIEGVFHTESARQDLANAEIALQDFAENILMPELRKCPLAIIRIQNQTSSPSKQMDADSFKLNDKKYIIKATEGDGACALHALLGEDIAGTYTYRMPEATSEVSHQARTCFINALQQQLNTPLIQQKFIDAIKGLINAPTGNASAQMLFMDSEKGCTILSAWQQLPSRYDEERKKLQHEEAALWCSLISEEGSPIFKKITEEIRVQAGKASSPGRFDGKNAQEILAELTENPHLIVNCFVNSEPTVYLNLLHKMCSANQQRKFKILREQQEAIRTNLDNAKREFLLRSDVIVHYMNTLINPGYYLNTQEICLAAHLFDKKVQLVTGKGSSTHPAEHLMNAHGDGDLIVIHHNNPGVHFSRCIEVTEPSADCSQTVESQTQVKYEAIDLKQLYEDATACTDCYKFDEAEQPKEIKEHLAYKLHPDFAPLREVAQFIQNKQCVVKLAKDLEGKKPSRVKKILRQSGQIQTFEQLYAIAKKIQPTSLASEISALLFQELYGKNLLEESDKYTQFLEKCGENPLTNKAWSTDDQYILDALSAVLCVFTAETNREEGEKSLDLLCQEYAISNPNSNISAIRNHIVTIRLYIEDLKKGNAIPRDSNLECPLALIAEICVAFEKKVMMRDTQLLAILAMLECKNPKGSLSQVKTGEGKSYIIAALAIIKHKQGHEVDIITSSATLARRDVEEFTPFYRQFGISAAHNCDADKGMLANPCYQRMSIVYGTPASFEGDSLRHEFYQAETFNGRPRGIAILDEADSMLLDKSSWLCQISDSVAGMSTTKPLLYYIWAFMCNELDKNKDKKFETKEEYDHFLSAIKAEIRKNTEAFFVGGNQSFVIPVHLKAFVDFRIAYWVESALNAIIYMQDKEYDYVTRNKITPIDFANTGEWENDVQWEDGLHQFLQMKHGAGVETETLTKSFMSNYALVNKYKSIYGLSGTLGGQEESNTLKALYGVDRCIIPTFKKVKFQEKPAWIAGSRIQWLDSLYTDVVMDGSEEASRPQEALPESNRVRKRASLIICNSIADVKEIQTHFITQRNLAHADIVTYTTGDVDRLKIKEATKGKIIIATNLSGRGTDINAEHIEANGGLHVIFSFLPANRRIQDQGFGRTARKGLSGTARLIIKAEDIRECHVQPGVNRPLLDICNDRENLKGNLTGATLRYDGKVWAVESDTMNKDGTRDLKVQGQSGIKTILLSHIAGKKELTYNTIEIDGRPLGTYEQLEYCSFRLTYDSIMEGRDRQEEARLNYLVMHEQRLLQTKQTLFEAFQAHVHGLAARFIVDARLERIRTPLLELYKSYILDEWAIFLDKVSKNQQPPNIECFSYASDLEQMIINNDLYHMQYINASIDVDDQSIRNEADAFYAHRGTKGDITAGFAYYNRVFVALASNKSDIALAKQYLNQAKAIFEKGETCEKELLKVQALTSPKEAKPTEEQMEGTPMLRLILTMKTLIERNLEELDQLDKDYNKLKVSFTSPYDLKAKSSPAPEQKKDDKKGYTIPDDLMQEAIKLGLKGVLKLEGEGTLWQAIVLAVACVLVAIAAIAAIALSGGAATPLVKLIGSKIIFHMIIGAVAGAAISGGINAIKGAVNGDFSFNKFGKDFAIGLVTGMIGAGIGAGLGGLAADFLKTAAVLSRVAVNAGIGAASGAAGGAGSYLFRQGINGKKFTIEEFSKELLLGAAGGMLGGGFAGILPHQATSIVLNMVTGCLGGTTANAVQQLMKMAFGDQKKFDGFELLENAIRAPVQKVVMQKAHKYANKQKQDMVPSSQGAPSPVIANRRLDALRATAARGTPSERIMANHHLIRLGLPPVGPVANAPVLPGRVGPVASAPVLPGRVGPVANAPVLPARVGPVASAPVLPGRVGPVASAPVLPARVGPVASAPVLPGRVGPVANAPVLPARVGPVANAPNEPQPPKPQRLDPATNLKKFNSTLQTPLRTNVGTIERNPLATNHPLNKSKSLDFHLNVLRTFEVFSKDKSWDNTAPRTSGPAIYRAEPARWDTWAAQNRNFFKNNGLTANLVTTALAKFRNVSDRGMHQLLNAPNARHTGIARVHVLTGALDGYVSVDVQSIRGYPGRWRLIIDLRTSNPVAIGDTHGLGNPARQAELRELEAQGTPTVVINNIRMEGVPF